MLDTAHLIQALHGIDEGRKGRLLLLVLFTLLALDIGLQGCGIRVGVSAIHDHQEGAVDAGAEAFGEQIRRLALGGIRVGGGIRRKRQLHVQDRGGQSTESEHHQGHDDTRDTLNRAHPTVTHRWFRTARAALRGVAGHAGDAPGEGFITEQAQHRGHQGQRHKHGHEDRARSGQAHGGKEADACHEQSEERDEDRRTGKDHGGARRADGHAGGIRPVHAGALLPVARHDEQRIIDAHGQTDHDGQHRGEVVELNPVGSNHDAHRS